MVKKPSRDTGLKDISTSVIRCPERVTDDLWVCILSHLSRVQVCDPMDCSPPGSSVHGILQARILEWVSMPYAKVSSQPRDQTYISCISCIGRQVLYQFFPPGKPLTCDLCDTLPKMHKLNWIMRKYQTNPNWESFTKELAGTLQKQSRLWRLLPPHPPPTPPKKKKPWEALTD